MKQAFSKLLRDRRIQVFIVLLLLGMLVLVYLRATEPDYSTGDPLFDRLQAEMHRNLNERKPGIPNTGISIQYSWPGAPTIEVLESWEGEFAERGDYWSLLAQRHALDGQGRTGAYRKLLERAAGCADSGSSVHGPLMEMELWDIRMNDKLDAWQEDEETARVIELYRRRFPDSAWVCYMAADHLAYYGMSAEYVELLELGNSLEDPLADELYPLAMVSKGLSDGTFRGDPLVAGAILRLGSSGISHAMSSMIRIRDHYKELKTAGTELGMVRGLNALYRREIRAWTSAQIFHVLPPASFHLEPDLFSADDFAAEGSEAQRGFSDWQAECRQYVANLSGIEGRLRLADPELAEAVMPGSPGMGLPGQRTAVWRDGFMGQVDNLLHLLDRSRLPRQLAQTEYDYTTYMLEHEKPAMQAMLEHLASFDFEHPEEYVAMDDVLGER